MFGAQVERTALAVAGDETDLRTGAEEVGYVEKVVQVQRGEGMQAEDWIDFKNK